MADYLAVLRSCFDDAARQFPDYLPNVEYRRASGKALASADTS